MSEQKDRHQSIGVTLVIVPRFPLLSLAICTEGLRVANRECLPMAFSWDIATVDGQPVSSSSGIPIQPTRSIREIKVSPVAIVLSAYYPEQAYSDELLAWLRHQDHQGSIIGCVDTGAFILAKAGLLSGTGVTVHQESVDPFHEAFDRKLIYDRLFSFEGRRLSSAGGMATFDMILALIARTKGEHLSDRVAALMNYQRLTDEPARQGAPRDTALARVNRELGRCVELMQANLEEPLPVEDICAAAGVPSWKARRLFQRYLRRSPADYYLNLRLERAKNLLAHSHAPIKQIAVACGFADTASFSRAFKRHLGRTPSDSRFARLGIEVSA